MLKEAVGGLDLQHGGAGSHTPLFLGDRFWGRPGKGTCRAQTSGGIGGRQLHVAGPAAQVRCLGRLHFEGQSVGRAVPTLCPGRWSRASRV